jgi:hypothetical protein
MNRIVSRLGALAIALSALTIAATTAAPAAYAQTKSKPTTSAAAKKKTTTKKSVRRSSSGKSTASRQAEAYRKLKDYNYVKSMSPYAGSPNKWGPKW